MAKPGVQSAVIWTREDFKVREREAVTLLSREITKYWTLTNINSHSTERDGGAGRGRR
jgi:hypothetical protein